MQLYYQLLYEKVYVQRELKCPSSAKDYVERNNLTQTLSVRLLKITLDNGETEVLVTNLLDKELYLSDSFKKFYALRWNDFF